MGFVKPNTAVMILVDTAKKEINKLTKEDMVIICRGTNIPRNASSKGLAHIMKFFTENQHTNSILINAPY
jgi:hypothetical protein